MKSINDINNALELVEKEIKNSFSPYTRTLEVVLKDCRDIAISIANQKRNIKKNELAIISFARGYISAYLYNLRETNGEKDLAKLLNIAENSIYNLQ
jgi:hypothetical protein